MRNSRSSILGAAALAALAFGLPTSGAFVGSGVSANSSGGHQADKGSPSKLATSNAVERAIYGGYGSSSSRRHQGKGWPIAHDRRMARKRRNQAKNRRAHRS